MTEENVKKAVEHFEKLVREQLERVDRLKNEPDWTDFSSLDKIIIGACSGDGIGPAITEHAITVMNYLLESEIKAGKVEICKIEGLTIENRAKLVKAIPDDVLEELKKCHVILKGPTTTPWKGNKYGWPNIESANVAMRRELDLFANVRPVQVPEKNIDWMFYRENTEGAYVLGSRGVDVSDDLAVDFKVITNQGSDRIIRAAFEYASKNNINKVTVVTKANVVKKTDGKFLAIAEQVAKDYPEVEWDDWYIDIMTAKLIDPARQSSFRVITAPNLYGDIITDEAAQIQGGLGTAGAANIGKRYSMFEAVHGSALKMVDDGRERFADPTSIIKAASMLLNHIGFKDQSAKLDKAIDICSQFEKKMTVTGRDTGCTGEQMAQYIIETVKDSNLDNKWQSYQ